MAGKKISRANMQRIQAIADHAHAMGAKHPGMLDYQRPAKGDMSLNDQLEVVARAVYASADGYCCIEETFADYVIIETGEDTYFKAGYTTSADGAVTLAARDSWVQVEETWQPVAQGAKAGLLDIEFSTATPYASMKAVGDRLLEVKVSYYGHKNGKDSHEEFFSPNTDFGEEDFPNPPLLYYHGFEANGKKMSKPAVTGKYVSRRRGPDAAYLTYKLKNTKYADLQWDSAQKGECVVSPGTIGHLIRKDAQTGELLYWALAEISAWDYAPGRAPANLHSVATPVIKALYLSEGIALPNSIETAASDQRPEAAGDAAGDPGAVDLSPEQTAQIITTEVTRALLIKNMRKP